MTGFFTKAHVADLEFKADNGEEEGVFSGYASVFNEIDNCSDIVYSGAFAQTLKVRPAPQIKMLMNHDRNKPVGRWIEAKQDSKGLYVKGKVNVKTSLGRDLWENIKEKVIDALSIGYIATEFSFKTVKQGLIRELKNVSLYEISFVTFPMLDSAKVELKNFTPSDIYNILTNSGINHNDSKIIATKGLQAIGNQNNDRQGLLDAMKNLNDQFLKGK